MFLTAFFVFTCGWDVFFKWKRKISVYKNTHVRVDEALEFELLNNNDLNLRLFSFVPNCWQAGDYVLLALLYFNCLCGFCWSVPSVQYHRRKQNIHTAYSCKHTFHVRDRKKPAYRGMYISRKCYSLNDVDKNVCSSAHILCFHMS